VGKKRVNKYPEAFRRMALERMKDCISVSALEEGSAAIAQYPEQVWELAYQWRHLTALKHFNPSASEREREQVKTAWTSHLPENLGTIRRGILPNRNSLIAQISQEDSK
jgi:hypothetical protein